jgi:hypothetical protein
MNAQFPITMISPISISTVFGTSPTSITDSFIAIVFSPGFVIGSDMSQPNYPTRNATESGAIFASWSKTGSTTNPKPLLSLPFINPGLRPFAVAAFGRKNTPIQRIPVAATSIISADFARGWISAS